MKIEFIVPASKLVSSSVKFLIEISIKTFCKSPKMLLPTL